MPPRWACCLSLVVLAACNQGATPVEKPRTPEQEVSQARGLPPGQEVPAAYDWPQWQGPDRTAVSRETGLLKQWPQEGPPAPPHPATRACSSSGPRKARPSCGRPPGWAATTARPRSPPAGSLASAS